MMRFLSLFVAGLLLAGCGNGNSTLGAGPTGTGGSSASSSSSSGVGGASAAIIQAYCDATAGPFCEAYFTCCPDPGSWLGSSVEECKRRFSYGGSWCVDSREEAYEAALEAGHTVFDQARVDACVAHLKAISAGGAACVEPPFALYWRECANAFRGQVPIGERCIGLGWPPTNATECIHGSCDDTHTCVPLAQLGDYCNNVAYPDCENGESLICSSKPSTNDLICVRRADIGEPCTEAVGCKSFKCDGTSATCVPLPGFDLCLTQ